MSSPEVRDEMLERDIDVVDNTFQKNQKFHLKPERAKSNVTKLFPMINNSLNPCFKQQGLKYSAALKLELSFRINTIKIDALHCCGRIRYRSPTAHFTN